MLEYLYGKRFGSIIASAKWLETSAYKIQTAGNYPEESIQHSGHGESFKSRILRCYSVEHCVLTLASRKKSCTKSQTGAIDLQEVDFSSPQRRGWQHVSAKLRCLRTRLYGHNYEIYI
jgi:hypothetical protein